MGKLGERIVADSLSRTVSGNTFSSPVHRSSLRLPHLSSHARPSPNFRDAHASVRQPAHLDPVQPRSRVQAGSESVPASLVRAEASNIEMLTDPQPVNTFGDFGILAQLLDAGTKVSVLQSDAPLVAARRIDNLPSRNGTWTSIQLRRRRP